MIGKAGGLGGRFCLLACLLRINLESKTEKRSKMDVGISQLRASSSIRMLSEGWFLNLQVYVYKEAGEAIWC